MITVFGSINIDLVACVDVIASPGATVMATGFQTFFGGKGANQAVAAARAAAMTNEVCLVAAIGQDHYGDSVANNLAANGVQALLHRLEASTGMAFISVDRRGENAITVVPGANAGLRSTHLTDAQLGRTSLVLMQLEASLAESLSVARNARQRGVPLMWNIAPMPTDMDSAMLRQLLGYTNYLVANAHEAKQLAALAATTGKDVESIVLALAAAHDLTCVVTLGDAGAVAATPDGRLTVMPAPQVTVIDTTGAGDTFCGVLAVGLCEGLPLDQVLRRAVMSGSLSCTAAGAQTSMPSRAQIDAALAAPAAH